MAKGVFIQNPSSVYNDQEGAHYHYPSMYHKRVQERVGDWVLLYQSGKAEGGRTYYAVAEVSGTRPDPRNTDCYYADYVPGSYLDFARRVPLKGEDGNYLSSVIQKSPGRPNGIAQSAVQPIRDQDFWKILRLGTEADPHLLMPRTDDDASSIDQVFEDQSDFQAPFERDRVESFLSRARRDRTFRAKVLTAYEGRCAFTGLGFVNGGGRAEVQAAHIRPVESGGPDTVMNGIALSGTVHWMFDRGLLSIGDNHEILVSRKVNDIESLDRLLYPSRKLRLPESASDSPARTFLEWHRAHVFER